LDSRANHRADLGCRVRGVGGP